MPWHCSHSSYCWNPQVKQPSYRYVCAYDDECGYLDSLHIDSSVAEGSCYKVGSGILSKLVVHGGSMFANLAGPEESEDTLVRILASEKQFRTFRNSWRENF